MQKLNGVVMNKIDLLQMVSTNAAEYSLTANESIQRNGHMNIVDDNIDIPQDKIEALLVDFVNFIGMKQGIDYAMYTSDLNKEQEKFKK